MLPRKAFAREFWTNERVDWNHLFELRRRWRTSVAMMVYRAHDLGLLDAVQFRQLYKGIYKRGWHRGEPDEPQHEQPELFKAGI